MEKDNKLNEKKFCFIICTNNEKYLEECCYYLNRIHVPEGYEEEIISIVQAETIAQGYNYGMKSTDAKYKIYLHQDVFILHQDILYCILEIFEDRTVGMIGMIGVTKMPEHGVMWYAERVGRIYSSNVLETNVSPFKAEMQYEVEAIDGLMMITQYDITWREDILRGWDFYDVSQSFEMRRAGYRIVVPRMQQPWCIHDDGFLNLDNYYTERLVILQEYKEYFVQERCD